LHPHKILGALPTSHRVNVKHVEDFSSPCAVFAGPQVFFDSQGTSLARALNFKKYPVTGSHAIRFKIIHISCLAFFVIEIFLNIKLVRAS
jgi:hypothetical protein